MSAVLLDIEGTTTPIAFVQDVLFPYARARLRAYLDESSAARMQSLMDTDSKDGVLKELQGRIWERGYADGSLTSVIYPDVHDAFVRWNTAGIRIAIYSSGSEHAQRLLFAHSDQGDLTRFIEAHFDTRIGAKREAASYRRISDNMHRSAATVLFVSDVVEELAAAREAGMCTLLSLRPGNAAVTSTAHNVIQSFAEITR